MSKIGRNEPCPCGSGKKYKLCCLKRREPTPDRDFVNPYPCLALGPPGARGAGVPGTSAAVSASSVTLAVELIRGCCPVQSDRVLPAKEANDFSSLELTFCVKVRPACQKSGDSLQIEAGFYVLEGVES